MFCRQFCHDNQLLIVSYTMKKSHETVLRAKSFMIIISKCTVFVLLFDCLLWNSCKVNSCQCSLNWDDNLSYDLSRDVCSRFLIHYSNFWFMFACLDFVKMFATILYFAIYDHMLKYDEMFDACSWHIYSYSHV